MPSMTGWITRLCVFLFAGVPAAAAQDSPVVVGAVVSESGVQAALASDYRKALLLWQDQVNAAGGLLGRRVELVLLDDGSHAVRAGPLYAGLIKERKADLLIGPYGSAATLLAAAEAERSRRVMVNGAGPARTVHKRAPQYVFQSVAPYSAYGAGVLELAGAAGCTSLFVLGRDDPVSAEMAEGTGKPAEIYSGGTADFAPLVAKARAVKAEAWIAFGEVQDTAAMVISFRRQGYAPPLFFASAATQPGFRTLVGQDAERSFGVIRYDARFATQGNDKFVAAFAARWAAEPGAAGAEGYAAATVLAEAVRRTGSLDQQKLRAMLSGLETETVLGTYKVNPANGEQVGIKPAVAQIVKGRPEIVWPMVLKTAEANIKCH